MAGEMIKEFLVGLGFQVNEQQLGSFKSSIKNATLAIGAMATAVTAAVGGVTAFLSSVADKYDDLGNLADRTNTSAAALSEFGFIAQMSGSSVEAAYSGIENLSRIAGEAAQGIGRGATVFEQLGLSAKDSTGALKDTATLLDDIRARIAGLSRGEQIAILERLGLDRTLIGALTSDISGLRAEYQKIYQGVGVDVNNATEVAGEFNQAMDLLKRSLSAIKDAVGLKFMGQFTDNINAARRAVQDNAPRIINAITPIIELVLRVGEAMVHIIGIVSSVASQIIDWFNKLNDATDGWVAKILALIVAWKLLNKSFLASPIGLIIALGAAIALLVDDFMVWKSGGDSLIDWSKWEPGINAAIDAMKFFRDELKSAFTVIIAMVDALIKVLTGDFTGAWNAVKEAVSSAVGVFENAWKAWSKLGSAMGKFGSAIKGSLGFLGIGGNEAPLAPSPSQQAQLSTRTNITQKTEINVQGSPNPDATARAVAKQQGRINADMVRNLRGATK